VPRARVAVHGQARPAVRLRPGVNVIIISSSE
jgi:hypothetical protein